MSAASKIRARMIEQLRTTGKLSEAPRPATAISAADTKDEAVRVVARLMKLNYHPAKRWLAPASNHSVLP